MNTRRSEINRTTLETEIRMVLDLDGTGEAAISTGIGFLDHLLTVLCKHAHFDIELVCRGDLDVDDHHTAEDCAIVLGSGLDGSLGDREGIARFGYAYAPLDEALARAVVDLSGRPFCCLELGLQRDRIGELSCENIGHVICSLAFSARASIHVDVLKGENDHHRAEAAFKALALALRSAVAVDNSNIIPSTKGVL